MTRTLLTLTALFPLWLSGCDLNEGPGEEIGETVDAIREGKSLDEIGDQADDVFQRRSSLEKRLDAVGDWLEARRKALADGTEELGDNAGQALDDIEQRMDKASKDLKDSGESVGEDIEQAIDDLETSMDELVVTPKEKKSGER